MNKSLWIGIGLFLALAIGAFVFLGRPKTANVTNENIAPTGTPAVADETTQGEPTQLQVEASEYSFNPDTITLSKGKKVLLTFRNTGKFPHNLNIPELRVATKTVSAGQSDTVEFVADKVGVYSFYCSIGGHKDLGMEGSLEVK